MNLETMKPKKKVGEPGLPTQRHRELLTILTAMSARARQNQEHIEDKLERISRNQLEMNLEMSQFRLRQQSLVLLMYSLLILDVLLGIAMGLLLYRTGVVS
jgi:hypothetical protein